MTNNTTKLSIGYYNSSSITEYEQNELEKIFSMFSSKQLQFISITDNVKDQLNSIDILLTFSDQDLLTFVQKFQFHNFSILAIEMPGDNSFFSVIKLFELEKALHELLNDNIVKDERFLLDISFDDKKFLALNDIHITSSKINARMRFDIQIDDNSLYVNQIDSANSILISTPTGATAMALNLGGAIIQKTAEVFQIQTVASRSLSQNHFIISNASSITVDIIETTYPLILNIDNIQVSTTTDKLTIMKSPSTIIFIAPLINNTNLDESSSKLLNKIAFEDTQSLTSSAKFILHVLQKEPIKEFTINEIMAITNITNQKTLRSALKLLMAKGLIKRKENLSDLREYLYFSKQRIL